MGPHGAGRSGQRAGGRYDLTRDGHGYYCREVVKRMYETWCHCRGLKVV
ncbi:hypothetical protein PTC90_14595 [Klebsiella grimontii]|nr:hypothetical protein [Klebsiella grimontii]WDC45861.1 hypothetical protein PTC90_14595 [Klebsiella grimontii]